MIKVKHTVFKGTSKEFTGSYSEICKIFNIKESTLRGRLERGYSLEEAIDYKGCYIQTVFKGTDREFTGNQTEIAKHFGIDLTVLNSRIRRGRTIEESIDFIDNSLSNIKYTVFKNTDREFTGNYKEISNHFNIKYNTLINRLKRTNCTLEEAIDWTPCNSITVYKNTDKEFTGNKKEISEHFHVRYSLIKNRTAKGYTIEEAIEIPTLIIKQNNFSYKGKRGNIKELCKEFNKNFIEVYNKIKNNHTLEWAMNNTTKPYEEN